MVWKQQNAIKTAVLMIPKTELNRYFQLSRTVILYDQALNITQKANMYTM